MTFFRPTSLLLLLLMSALGVSELFAQSRGINYQAVARNNDGSLLANQAINVRFFIRQSTAAGVVVYEETHAPTTNAYGLFSLEIGAGTVVSGTLDAIEWASDRYFLEVQLNGVSAGASELIDVPYAKVATDMALSDLKDVDANAPANGQTLKWNGSEWAPAADEGTTYAAGAGLSLSGTTFSALDPSPTNEIQALSLSGNTLNLSQGGGSVNLPTGTTYTPGDGIAISGANAISATLGTSIQTSEIANAAVTEPKLASNSVTSTKIANNAVITAKIANGAVTANKLGQSGAANGQVLKWNGTAWAPAADDGGTASQWTTSGNNIFYNTGNVGIGEATPAATLTVGNGDKFQVQGATGTVVMTDPMASIRFPTTTGTNAPMMFQFTSGTQNRHRMVVAHSPGFSDWGIQYQDTADLYNFLANGTPVLTVRLLDKRVGVGQEDPLGKLHVKANSVTTTFPHLLLEEDATNDYARLQFQNLSGASKWQIAGLTSATSGGARLKLSHSVAGNILSLTDNKRVGINTGNPTHELEVVHQSFGGSNTNNGMKIRNQNANNTNWTLYSFNFSGDFGLFEGSTQRGQFAAGTGAYTTVSDQRLKSDFSEPGNLLPAVMQLNTFRYSYTSDPKRKSVIGCKAQEVESLFPEVVYRTGEDGQGYALDYAGFGVIAIKAVQEQQEIIDAQQAVIEDLVKRLEALEKSAGESP